MKQSRWIKGICAVAIGLCYQISNVNAAVGNGQDLDLNEGSMFDISKYKTNYQIGQSYRLKKPVIIKAIETNNEDQLKAISAGMYATLPSDAEFVIIDTYKDETGEYLRLGLDVETDSEMPSDLWVRTSDLVNAQVQLVDTDLFTEENYDQIAEEDLGNDDEYAETQVAGKAKAKKAPARKTKGMTYCYREVKQTLLKMKICKKYASGSMAYQGYSVLQKECGMKPAKYSDSLPIGAVCVSTGGRCCNKKCTVKCGHIAVKTGKNTWYGAGYRPTPWLSGRTPKGCLVKK